MRNVILHLGAHRCGSTTIQRVLRDNSDSLASSNISVWTRREIVQNPGLSRLMLLHERPLGIVPAALALHRICKGTAVISEENILGRMLGVDGGGLYEKSGRAIRALALLSNLFACSIRWVMRRQDRLIESAYSFRVLRGATDDFATFSNRCGDLRWFPTAKALGERSFDTRIALFEGLLPGTDAERIFEFLGLPSEALRGKRLRAINASSDWAQGPLLNVMVAINRLCPELSYSQRLAVTTAISHFGRKLPAIEELLENIQATRIPISTDSIRDAFRFASTAPLPEFDQAARRSLLTHYRDDHSSLEKLSYVNSYGASWRET